MGNRLEKRVEMEQEQPQTEAERTQAEAKRSDNSRPAVCPSTLSPSGRVSKAARSRAHNREAARLFTDEDGNRMDIAPRVEQPTPAANMRRRATELRALAARGMSPRKFAKEADRLDAAANLSITSNGSKARS